MKTKSIPVILLGLCLLTSCFGPNKDVNNNKDDNSNVVEDDVDLVKKDLKLYDKSYEPMVSKNKLTTYYLKNSNVPLVGVSNFINTYDGYFDANLVKKEVNGEVITFSWKLEGKSLTMVCDCKNDTITVNDLDFFKLYNYKEDNVINKHLMVNDVVTNKNEVVFDLKKYGFDSLIKNKDVLLPFNIINTLFCMTNYSNTLYNGEAYYFFDYYLDSQEDVYSTRRTVLEGKDTPEDIITARNNGMYFTLDYFYGLRELKGIDSFKNEIENNPKYKNNFNSPKSSDFEKGMVDYLITHLDDSHTYLGYLPYYSYSLSSDTNYFDYDYTSFGPKSDLIDLRFYELSDEYQTLFPDNKIVDYYLDTAFIKFDEFLYGYDEECYDKNGNVLSSASDKDTYCLFYNAFKDIEKHKNIKNVVIDLSTNGGGEVLGLYQALGFLTNEDIEVNIRDTLSGSLEQSKYKVDVDNDGDFNDLDAYTQYNYYVKTSKASYSAANTFASVCKEMNLATLIGEESGGGSCIVNEIALLDGSTFSFSSNNSVVVKKDNKWIDIDDGITVDKKIPLSKFYDYKYIVNNIINK